jgi:peptidoglycan/LPS O-acetylase OafA/YrhL
MTSTSQISTAPRAPLPGLDGLRLLGALAVIFSHAYLVSTGSEEREPLVRLLGKGNILGLYGVFTFFIISGFLLARSLADRMDPIVYTVNRALRLLPAFVVCTLVTALVIGTAFTSLPLREYLAHPGTLTYLKMTLITLGDNPLPGVFETGSAVWGVVNGSLWSLQFEALSYVVLLAFWLVLRKSVWVGVAITLLALVTHFNAALFHALRGFAYTLPFFAGGVAMYVINARFGMRWQLALLCALALVATATVGTQHMGFATFGAYIIIFFGERNNPASALARRIGDCSYGLYLYGWPVEQMVKQVTGTSRPLVMFAIAAPLTFALAYMSYHLVELPAMSRRRALATAIRGTLERLLTRVPRARITAGRAAQLSFVVAVAFILASKDQWWYFLPSITMMAAAAVAGSLLVIAWCAARPARAADM